MKALADKVHKQGEHIPQHCYMFYTYTTVHPYTYTKYLTFQTNKTKQP